MLILTRKPGESIFIGDQIKVTVVEIKGSQIRIGVEAPRDLRIYREEIYQQILEENKQAAVQGELPGDMESLAAHWKGGAAKPGKLSKLSAQGSSAQSSSTQGSAVKPKAKPDGGNSDE